MNARSDSPRVRTPREHGFWVMLGLATTAGLLMQPTWAGVAVAVAIAFGAVLGAVVVGKRIRKNPVLQLMSTVLLGFIPAPIALAGGENLARVLLVCMGLALAFTSGALLVVAVLQRARKRRRLALLSGWLGLWLAVAGSLLFLYYGHPYKAGALSVTTFYAAGILVWRPSAKRLKLIGMTISGAHALSVVLLIL